MFERRPQGCAEPASVPGGQAHVYDLFQLLTTEESVSLPFIRSPYPRTFAYGVLL